MSAVVVIAVVVVVVVVVVIAVVVISAAVIAPMPGAVTVIGSAVIIDCAPMPVAIPGAVSPTIAHHCSDSQSGAEGEDSCGDHRSGTVSGSYVWIAVHNSWVVFRNIDDLRVCGLDNDGLRRLLNDGNLCA